MKSFRLDAGAKVTSARPPAPQLPTGPCVTDSHVTQYGTTWFRAEPSFDDPNRDPELDLSVFRGSLSVDEAARAMFGRDAKGHDAARRFEVPRLVAATYRCIATARPKRPLHASILAATMDGDIGSHIAWWRAPDRIPLISLAEEVAK